MRKQNLLMVPSYPVIDFEASVFEQAAMPLQAGSSFIPGLILGLIAVVLLFAYSRNPQFFARLWSQLMFFIFPRSHRHEARLERVICHSCNQGTGVYDPVYVTYAGENYIEGICSCCGNFVRARLR